MIPTQKQNWHPITMLPMFAKIIDGQLGDDVEQYKTLLEALPKPHVLDDALIQRVISVYAEKRLLLSLHLNQFAKWENDLALTSNQKSEVERLREQVIKLQKVVSDILCLADELKLGTIEKVMVKSDLEMGIEYLKKYF